LSKLIPKVSEEFAKIVFPLTPEEYGALKQSIKENGQYLPIIVNEEGIVLDGHHRLRACQELVIEPKTEVKNFPDKFAEKRFVIAINVNRRQLSDFQKAELGLELLDLEKEEAEARQKAGTSVPNGAKAGKSTEIVAKEVGLSTRTFERYIAVIKSGSEDLIQAVRDNKRSISSAYETLRHDVELHSGTLLADRIKVLVFIRKAIEEICSGQLPPEEKLLAIEKLGSVARIAEIGVTRFLLDLYRLIGVLIQENEDEKIEASGIDLDIARLFAKDSNDHWMRISGKLAEMLVDQYREFVHQRAIMN
jgi:ParB-like chromosome segregation protein Spo0J